MDGELDQAGDIVNVELARENGTIGISAAGGKGHNSGLPCQAQGGAIGNDSVGPKQGERDVHDGVESTSPPNGRIVNEELNRPAAEPRQNETAEHDAAQGTGCD